ncbi:hypothetical protein [Ruania alba]|uniref:Uncharacterized protein n=1 Tax=Ruania alba TaxID=648782 RepID=A0A1H5LAR8_9MICO|nr:hypothetical protein [Ruania alba]SEE74133.1 hypothetical protein SAMN04488554_2708 [Ruania alba]
MTTTSRAMINDEGPTRRQVLATGGAAVAGAVAAGSLSATPAAAVDGTAADAAARLPEFWYQDNNLGQGGRGAPPDLESRYDNLDTWRHARRAMHTFSFGQVGAGDNYADVVKYEPELLDTMASAHADMNFAFNVTQATTWWWHKFQETGEIPEGPPDFTATINNLRQLRAAGFNLTNILLQSVLSKPGPGRFLGYSMERRIQDVVEFNDQVRGEFPDVQIGVIYPLNDKPGIYPPWREVLTSLQSELRSSGHELDFIHFDKPFEHPRLEIERPSGPMTWDRMVEVERFIKGLGVTFGLQCTDGRAGRQSNNAFRRRVLEGIATYVDHGGAADRYILWPFHPYPDHSTPDTLGELPPEGASQMRIFREMARGAAARRH